MRTYFPGFIPGCRSMPEFKFDPFQLFFFLQPFHEQVAFGFPLIKRFYIERPYTGLA
jgi:hypothetical protein